MSYDFFGLTDKGIVRQKNEDCWKAIPEQDLFIVADGIGGMPAGDIASQLVVEVLPPLMEKRLNKNADTSKDLSRSETIARIKQSIIDLSNRILHESENRSEFAGMGSTLVMALIQADDIYVAHLGDSRAYLLKNDLLQQLTNDHTMVRQLLMNQEITQEQAQNHPARNQLLQYIGMSAQPRPEVICIPKEKHTSLLLCSDGVTAMLSTRSIKTLVEQDQSPKQICRTIIDSANQAGGKDNITTILIQF